MSTMTETDRYNGYANRETWAFNLHWQNDQGLYNETLEVARQQLADLDEDGNDLGRGDNDGLGSSASDYAIGQHIVTYWHDTINEWDGEYGTDLPVGLAMFRDEVGSWWRIDYAEVGAAVRESLEVEGDSPAN